MADYTTPVTAAFELQRQTIQQSQRAFEQAVAAQQTFAQSVVDSFDAGQAAQRRTIELNQRLANQTLDVAAANVPGVDAQVAELRDTIDEQYDLLLENHSEAVQSIETEFEEGLEAYEEFSDDYLAALEEQVDLLLEAHEELETQSADALEEAAEQVEELQAQADEIGEQVRDVQSRAADIVEA